MQRNDADGIRLFVEANYITTARAQGEKCIPISARDVHDRMRFQNRYPKVCQVLSGKKLQQNANIELIKTVGTNPGPNAYFCYKLL
jgi:hypothetical protein